jgi:peptide chain release factor subunit 1
MVEKMDMQSLQEQGDDRHIEVWKIKKLIQKLETCKGNGTSFVSLYIPPKENINLVTGKLA